jgi:phosphofructokinase-like protein
MMARIGILTGGGDCPGLNPVIRGIVLTAHSFGHEVLGILNGYQGMLTGENRPLKIADVQEIIYQGGTIVGTSRTNLAKEKNGIERAKETFKKLGLDALICIGGEDTLGVAFKLYKSGLPVVGVPKTIDNDLPGTEFCFGFDTAVNIATEAIDRLRTTAKSHSRVMVVEVMGRHAGWIAAFAGIASSADAVLTPEYPMTIDDLSALLQKKRAEGKNYALVVVSEGTPLEGLDLGEGFAEVRKEKDAFGHVQLGGVGETITKALKEKTGFDCRNTILGHIQRGGSPTSMDRILGSAYGVEAMKLVQEKNFGKMPALQNGTIVPESLEEASKGIKIVPESTFSLVRTLFES